jgi:hypothetical protein
MMHRGVPQDTQQPAFADSILGNLLGKAVVSPLVALPIGIVLAVTSSLRLDQILESHGLAGARDGIFFSGVLDAIFRGVIGGVFFGYTFAFRHRRGRIAPGAILGVIGGAHFAHEYNREIAASLLGKGYFLSYGALWGALGGAIFAAVIRRVFVRYGLTPAFRAPTWLTDKTIVSTSVVTLLAGFVPIVFNETEVLSAEKLIVIAGSYTSCESAVRARDGLRLPKGVYDARVAYAINGKYAVSLGPYNGALARRMTVQLVRNGTIPRDSFLLSVDSLVNSSVTCE